LNVLLQLIVLAFLLLLCAGLWVARRYGPIRAYVGFAWLIPLTSIIWFKWEFESGLGSSALNVPFVLTVIGVSFVLAVVCFPLLVYRDRGRLSPLRAAGLLTGALLHGFPFLLYVLVFASVLIWGK
jgi:hypothetical protein